MVLGEELVPALQILQRVLFVADAVIAQPDADIRLLLHFDPVDTD